MSSKLSLGPLVCFAMFIILVFALVAFPIKSHASISVNILSNIVTQASYGKGPDYLFSVENSSFPCFSVLLLFSMKIHIELENDQYDSFK